MRLTNNDRESQYLKKFITQEYRKKLQKVINLYLFRIKVKIVIQNHVLPECG